MTDDQDGGQDDQVVAGEVVDRPAPAHDVQDPDWINGRQKWDWLAVKRRYVEGVYDNDRKAHTFPSLTQVAEHFGIPSNRVREKSASDGWVGAREQYQAQLEVTRQQARAAALARSGLDLDDRALDVSKAGLQLVNVALQEQITAAQAARAATVGEGTPRSGIDSLKLQRLAAAAELFHKIGLRAVGDPETSRIEITGAGGRPIEMELHRDDPERLTGVLAVLGQAGLGDLFGVAGVGRPALGAGGSDGGQEPT